MSVHHLVKREGLAKMHLERARVDQLIEFADQPVIQLLPVSTVIVAEQANGGWGFGDWLQPIWIRYSSSFAHGGEGTISRLATCCDQSRIETAGGKLATGSHYVSIVSFHG